LILEKIESRVDKETLYKELVREIENLQFMYCSFCDRTMFTVIHIFMHINEIKHWRKFIARADLINVHQLLVKMVNLKHVDLPPVPVFPAGVEDPQAKFLQDMVPEDPIPNTSGCDDVWVYRRRPSSTR
ncbi:hypothetical protein PMAYCL1PPCAC_00569, partial [Pristionchus mayeri]